MAPRLRRVDCSGPGYTRHSRGKKVTIRAPDGSPAHDPEVLDRITSLVIPPAWTDVWICPWTHGHIQATGVDARGRRQYLYHPVWREQQDRVKFDRVLDVLNKTGVVIEHSNAVQSMPRGFSHAGSCRVTRL